MAIRYYVAFPAGICTLHYTVAINARVLNRPRVPRQPRRTFTGLIGTVCMFPLRAIIAFCVALRIHPNVLTLVGVIVNIGAAWALAYGRFALAGFVMIV